jgi:arabinose-5-phosphate isomerase
MPRVVEACPNRLAPTSSTTVQLAIGDAIAVALIDKRGFSAADFRTFHPGGKLGAQLMIISDLMGKGDEMPTVGPEASLLEATVEMTRKRYGTAAVVDESGLLLGAFTDGDLRRSVSTANLDDAVRAHMSAKPVTIAPDLLASDALHIMNEREISALFVAKEGKLVGLIHVHDLLRAGVA